MSDGRDAMQEFFREQNETFDLDYLSLDRRIRIVNAAFETPCEETRADERGRWQTCKELGGHAGEHRWTPTYRDDGTLVFSS